MDAQAAIEKRDIGIHRAVEKADRDDSGWSWRAYYALLKYVAAHKGQFLTEEVRDWSESQGHVIAPENGRAWGAVMQRAARRGIIRKAGYALAKSSNLSPKVLWENNDLWR
jgi:hypothetical protein